MRIIIITIFVFFQVGFLFGQDGSNMWYIKPEKLDKSYIGKQLHIDFYRRSFGGFNLDKVFIEIKGKKIEFIEHREDDGFNNWFMDQRLESVDIVDNVKIIIKNFKLLEIDKESILVLAFINIKPYEQEIRFKKGDIAELLFKDN